MSECIHHVKDFWRPPLIYTCLPKGLHDDLIIRRQRIFHISQDAQKYMSLILETITLDFWQTITNASSPLARALILRLTIQRYPQRSYVKPAALHTPNTSHVKSGKNLETEKKAHQRKSGRWGHHKKATVHWDLIQKPLNTGLHRFNASAQTDVELTTVKTTSGDKIDDKCFWLGVVWNRWFTQKTSRDCQPHWNLTRTTTILICDPKPRPTHPHRSNPQKQSFGKVQGKDICQGLKDRNSARLRWWFDQKRSSCSVRFEPDFLGLGQITRYRGGYYRCDPLVDPRPATRGLGSIRKGDRSEIHSASSTLSCLRSIRDKAGRGMKVSFDGAL